MTLEEKHDRLIAILQNLGSVVVAYSGGVDSALLLAAACEALGPERCLAVTAVSPSLASEEYQDAQKVAVDIGAEWISVATHELDNPQYRANDRNRCYHCRKTSFSVIVSLAEDRGYAAVVDGFNADDTGDWRPGARAARELGVLSPLKEANLGKEEIRELCRRYGLSISEKPSSACLSSRVPYGTEITPERLRQIDTAETFLRKADFRVFRVRYHGDTARLELGESEISSIADPVKARNIAEGIRKSGFKHVAFDVAGFQSGSMNRTSDSTNTVAPAVILHELGFKGADYRTTDQFISIGIPESTWRSLWTEPQRTRITEGFRNSEFIHVGVHLVQGQNSPLHSE